MALSFAVGVFIGISPFLGLQTVMSIAMAWIFNLNKLVTIAGSYITNPWTIIPIYTFATWLGAKLLGMQQIIPNINWNEMSFGQLLYEMKSLILPFWLGTTLLGLISGVLGYFAIYYTMVRSKKK